RVRRGHLLPGLGGPGPGRPARGGGAVGGGFLAFRSGRGRGAGARGRRHRRKRAWGLAPARYVVPFGVMGPKGTKVRGSAHRATPDNGNWAPHTSPWLPWSLLPT